MSVKTNSVLKLILHCDFFINLIWYTLQFFVWPATELNILSYTQLSISYLYDKPPLWIYCRSPAFGMCSGANLSWAASITWELATHNYIARQCSKLRLWLILLEYLLVRFLPIILISACHLRISVCMPANNPLKTWKNTGCVRQSDFKTKTNKKTLPTKYFLKNLSN